MSGQARRKQITSVGVDEIHENTSTELITITSDKLKIIIMEYLSKVESSKSWQTPLGIVITIVLVFVSSEFKDAFNIPAATWRAIFFIAAIISVVWLIFSLAKIKSSLMISDVLDIIKNKV